MNTRLENELHKAVCLLAGVCDGARLLDGQGYNMYDSEYGHTLASEDFSTWTRLKCECVRKFLYKYRNQLDRSGIDIDTLFAPSYNVSKGVHNGFDVHFDYDTETLRLFKLVFRRKIWDAKNKIWNVLIESSQDSESLIGFSARFGLSIEDDALVRLRKLWN